MKLQMIVFLLLCGIATSAQQARRPVQSLRLQVPVIYNRSEATCYVLGRPLYPWGHATSYGIKIDYSRLIHSHVYLLGGVGYFKQLFGIKRPFYYTSPTQPVFYTRVYKYDNLMLFAGAGYQANISDDLIIKGELTYNRLHSFRQKYVITQGKFQVNKSTLDIGTLMVIGGMFEKKLSDRYSGGFGILLPVATHWNNDPMFFKYDRDYATDAQQIARTQFSIGMSLEAAYHF